MTRTTDQVVVRKELISDMNRPVSCFNNTESTNGNITRLVLKPQLNTEFID